MLPSEDEVLSTSLSDMPFTSKSLCYPGTVEEGSGEECPIS